MTLPGFDYPDQSAWGWAPGVWQDRTARRILESTAAETITVTIPAALAYHLKVACADSAASWHQHWRDVAEGKRSDLDATACVSLSRKAWELWEILHSQGV